MGQFTAALGEISFTYWACTKDIDASNEMDELCHAEWVLPYLNNIFEFRYPHLQQ